MKYVIRVIPGNVRSENCPFGELSLELSVGELPVGEMSLGNCPSGKYPSAKSPSGKCPSGNCPRTDGVCFGKVFFSFFYQFSTFVAAFFVVLFVLFSSQHF